MSRYQAAVYPFSQGLLPYFQPWTQSLLKRAPFDITSLIAPGQFDAPRDISYIDSRPETGTTLRTDLRECLEQSDTLLVPAANYPEASRQSLLNLMLQTISAGKNIRCGYPLKAEEESALRAACDRQKVSFVCASTLASQNGQRLIEAGRDRKYSEIQQIDTPILFVADTAPSSNAVDVAAGLVALFEQKGYRVSAVLEPGNAQLFGFHGWDEPFAYKYDILETHQYVADINAYFVGLNHVERPHLIVVKLPKGIMPLNQYESNGFGLYAHMFFQAIHPDYFTLCLMNGQYDNESISQFGDLCEKRFGHRFDSLHLSNSAIDGSLTVDTGTFQALCIQQEEVDAFIGQDNWDQAQTPMLNGLSLHGITKLCNHAEDMLASYSDHTAVV